MKNPGKSSGTLRRNSLVIVLFVMASLALVLYFSGRHILERSFLQIEQDDAIDRTQRVLRLLEDRQASLQATAKDYAAWDDTYQFVVTHDPAYIKATLLETTFQNARLNVIEIWDAENRQVISRWYDEAKGEFFPRPQSLDDYLRGPASLLGHASVDSEKSGLVLLESGLLMVVSLPITTSNNEGPIRGTLLMGRYLDEKAVEKISGIMGSRVELIMVNSRQAASVPHLPSNSEPIVVSRPGPNSVTGYALLQDLAGKPAVMVKVSLPRPIWQEAERAMTILRYSLISTILVAWLVTFLVWERLVLSRLSNLSSRLADVGAGGDLSARLPSEGKDELAKLASDINNMLQLLENSEARYKELFNSISDLVCSHDLEGRLLTVNDAAKRVAGMPEQALVGRNLIEFIPSELHQAFEEQYMAVIKAKKYFEGVAKFKNKDGGLVYLECRNRLVEERGREPFVIGSARDVTLRITADREMRRLEERVFRSQKLEAIGVLAGGIAHDFNNVLQSISSGSQLLREERELSLKGRDRLDRIDLTIKRAARMINQLLTLGRNLEPRRETINFNLEVAQTLEILNHTLPKMIRIHTDLAPDLKPFSGDPGQIEQLLLNLANNAAHAMPEGGELTIRTRNIALNESECKVLPGLQPGEYLQIKVADTGVGMDEETKRRIFEPFFTTKAPGGGTGLGLSTVYGIVNHHGGQIYCQSSLNSGTEFTIYLPIALAKEHEIDSQDQPAPPKSLVGDETILFVDDEPFILQSGREALEGFGYRVLTAMHGEKALEIFLENYEEISLVIMDLNMPGMGGLESMSEMLLAHPGTKILVATGYAEPGLEDMVRRIGGLELLGKPYSFSNLLVKVRSILDNPSKQPTDG